MRNLLMCIVLMFSLTSCKAQDTLPEPKGHTVAYVVELTDKGAVANAGGRSMIIDNSIADLDLIPGTEYDFVYHIVEYRGKTMVVKLIGAEYSAGESARRRAKLLLLMR